MIIVSDDDVSALDRCHVHLFKQIYTSVDLIVMSNNHTTQEGDGFCVPQMEVFCSKNMQSDPRTKGKDIVKMLADVGKFSVLCLYMSWKADQRRAEDIKETKNWTQIRIEQLQHILLQ